jgi:hypothetical protein
VLLRRPLPCDRAAEDRDLKCTVLDLAFRPPVIRRHPIPKDLGAQIVMDSVFGHLEAVDDYAHDGGGRSGDQGADETIFKIFPHGARFLGCPERVRVVVHARR